MGGSRKREFALIFSPGKRHKTEKRTKLKGARWRRRNGGLVCLLTPELRCLKGEKESGVMPKKRGPGSEKGGGTWERCLSEKQKKNYFEESRKNGKRKTRRGKKGKTKGAERRTRKGVV